MAAESAADRAIGRAERRIVWFLGLLYFFAILDRVNVGFAALTMNKALGLTPAAFGFGAGIFFLGYVVFEIPSVLAMPRFGARRWIARIMISWGICSLAIAFVPGVRSFFTLRFLLGAAEAGFQPGVIWFLSTWFPRRERARVNAMFLLGLPISNGVAAALSGVLLRLDGLGGLAGWQWLFIAEALPTIVLGFVTLRVLVDRPADAGWLAPGEKQALMDELAAEEAGIAPMTLREAMLRPIVWVLGIGYFGLNVGLSTLGLWLPQIVHSFGGMTPTGASLATSGVLLIGAVIMLLWSRHSDRKQERVRHATVAAILASWGWLLAAFMRDPAWRAVTLVAAAGGTYATYAVFWTYPAAITRGRSMAGGIGMIGTIGAIGGFLGPWAIGQLRDMTHDFAFGFIFTAAMMGVTGMVALYAGHRIFERPSVSAR
jgi:MFS family permease